jgi:hypothetical protein
VRVQLLRLRGYNAAQVFVERHTQMLETAIASAAESSKAEAESKREGATGSADTARRFTAGDGQ